MLNLKEKFSEKKLFNKNKKDVLEIAVPNKGKGGSKGSSKSYNGRTANEMVDSGLPFKDLLKKAKSEKLMVLGQQLGCSLDVGTYYGQLLPNSTAKSYYQPAKGGKRAWLLVVQPCRIFLDSEMNELAIEDRFDIMLHQGHEELNENEMFEISVYMRETSELNDDGDRVFKKTAKITRFNLGVYE